MFLKLNFYQTYYIFFLSINLKAERLEDITKNITTLGQITKKEKEATKDDLLAMKQLVEQLRTQGIDPQIVFEQATNLYDNELKIEAELNENNKKV